MHHLNRLLLPPVLPRHHQPRIGQLLHQPPFRLHQVAAAGQAAGVLGASPRLHQLRKQVARLGLAGFVKVSKNGISMVG